MSVTNPECEENDENLRFLHIPSLDTIIPLCPFNVDNFFFSCFLNTFRTNSFHCDINVINDTIIS